MQKGSLIIKGLLRSLGKLNHFPVSLQQLLCDGRCLEDDEQVDGTEELQLVMLGSC